MTTTEKFYPERFTVDTLGMRQLHQQRKPEQLVKELVQNVFDEEDASNCKVAIQRKKAGVQIIVEDDGLGFSNVSDAYTLMGDTVKRMNPERRGRFNMGEKEVLCVATWATVETVGSTVEFPESGGRLVKRNRRRRGTRITAMMPWGDQEAERLIQRMKMIRPPEEISYSVNGEKVYREPALMIGRIGLDTVVQDAPGSPMRTTHRRTNIHILPKSEDSGWIYEMGIPIQEIEASYSVDVMQKVPMPPNRDTVSAAYLKKIYTEILNIMHDQMLPENFSENWVRAGMENRAVEADSVKTVIQNRYGDHVVIRSSNPDTNMKATDAGYQVLHPRSLGKDELENMKNLGELKTAHEIFGRDDEEKNTAIVEPGNTVRDAFAEWVTTLGRMAEKEVTVVFTHNDSTKQAASCTMNTENPEMRFNTHHLNLEFFAGREEEQLELVIHELGHAEMDGKMSHGPRWGEACCRVGSMIALGLAAESQDK